MLGRYRWLLLAVIVVGLVVAGVVVWRGHEREEEFRPAPISKEAFTADDVPVTSPDINVGVGVVRWKHHPGYTDWACLIECRESDGCRAEIQLVVDYVSSGESKRLTLGGRLDSTYGETVRIGRAQRPAVVVDRVDQVTVDVLAAYHPGVPKPTPME